MEINNLSSSSLIYLQYAQNKANKDSIDKTDIEKSTQDSYDKLNSSNTNYDENNFEKVTDSVQLESVNAQLIKSANLNKLFLENQQLINEQGTTNG